MDDVEVSGGFEALARLTLHLTAALEEAGLIDGWRFAEQLRESIKPAPDSPPHLAFAQVRLQELAFSLDSARVVRAQRAC